jgi:hypothetical protein
MPETDGILATKSIRERDKKDAWVSERPSTRMGYGSILGIGSFVVYQTDRESFDVG